MRKELRHDAQTIGLQTMDGLIVIDESVFEKICPHAIKLAKPLADHAIELLVCAFLACTFDDHRCKFFLEAVGKVDTHELVTAFFEAST